MDKKYIIVVQDNEGKKHYLDAAVATPSDVAKLGNVIEYKEVE